ncbi:C-terminal binding protein [Cohnella abietis]|uniref:D-isomer specific 2-hydroxyacid dehydrogenase family protein n=1 Tax=Cohnella abietis TaxID=2507935 RepID=A0A3T1DBK2_9BACL|nr:C-terminal binding protein [Cohnella abietis]BBI35469.1 D-isomer specific 2-hydroxyacid dehydrogenase family protein [Cohnella abietis]
MKAYALPHEFSDLHQERQILKEIGVELIELTVNKSDEIIREAADGVALFVQYTPITAEIIEGLQHCQVIIRYGIGFDNVDLLAAAKRGIWVCNIPHYCMDEVADHTFALLLGASRKLTVCNESVHKGEWDFLQHRPIQCLAGKTLGLAGFGQIAQMVAKRAKAFDMKIITHDPWASPEALAHYDVRAVTRDELFATSDYLSLHMPLNEDTRYFVSADTLNQMKEGVVIVNTARGALVNIEDAAAAVVEGKIGVLCLDVLEQEPPSVDNPLIGHSNVILTPHSAYYSEESLPRLQRLAGEEAARVISGALPNSPVNASYMKKKERAADDSSI